MQDEPESFEDVSREEALRPHQSSENYFQQMSGSVMEGANIAIKASFVVNGGAVIAILAFIPNL